MSHDPAPWWQRVLVVLIALVPFYGHFVHAARDGQDIALVIFLCWAITCVTAVVVTARAVIRPPESSRQRRSFRLWSTGLLIAAVLGWGGVRAAFYELLAG